jgi:secretion/DNA translocation related TadE-like protein
VNCCVLRSERGSGTIVALGLIAALMTLLALVVILGAAAAAKTQAGRASDLAALAAADTARGLNSGDPCTVAEQVAERNGSVLAECAVGGEFPTEVTVTVAREVDSPLIPDLLPLEPLTATGSSRAGPPDASP